MNNQYQSDLDIAKDLEKLSNIVTEAIQKATKILEKVQETDAYKDLIERMEQATRRLESEKKFLEDIQQNALEALQTAEDITSELQNLRDLPNLINQLGINTDLLSEAQLILTEARHVEDACRENLANIETIQQGLESIEISVQKNESISTEIKKLYKNALMDVTQFQELVSTEKGEIEAKFNDLGSYVRESERRLSEIIQNGVSNLENLTKRNESILLGINQIISEIGGIEAFRSLLNESRSMRALIQETRQEVIAVRNLEIYITEFRRHQNSRKLMAFLWDELGWTGMIIYFFRLIIPRRRRKN